jgi:hypothetical protein
VDTTTCRAEVAQAAVPGEEGLDIAVGLAVGVAVPVDDVVGVVAEADVEGEAAGVELPQPASRPAEPATAAMAIRIRVDVIWLPPSIVAMVVTTDMTPVGARWLRPAGAPHITVLTRCPTTGGGACARDVHD